MKMIKQFVIFSACSILTIACDESATDEGTPIEDPSADAEAQTTPPTPEELEAMQNGSE